MRTQNFAVLFAHQKLNEAFRSPRCDGLTRCLEGEFADLVFDAFFLELILGLTDRSDLRDAVSAAREIGHLLRLAVTKHALHRLNRFVGRHMREPRWPNDVAGRVDPLDAGFVVAIDFDVTAILRELGARRQ